jgi:hypothetical protein
MTSQRTLWLRFHFKRGRPALPRPQGLVSDSGALGELVCEQTSEITVFGVTRRPSFIKRSRSNNLIQHSRSTWSCAMLEHSLDQTIGLELAQMRASGVAMQVDCPSRRGRVDRSATTKDA